MPLEGRGKEYSRTRAFSEWALGIVMQDGWGPRLVARMGLQQPVQTVEHRVWCRRWPAGLAPLRIGFMSDLHAGPTTHPALIEEAIDAMRAAEPDVVLLGGDYVYLHAHYFEAMVPLLARIRAPLGRFAVFGNHDLWADDRRLARGLADAGFTVLVNESHRLPAPYDRVAICGLDDPWVGQADPDACFAAAEADVIRVLLMHAPEGLLHVGARPFDLAICGHTHGGHIALPGGVPIVNAGPLSGRFSAGRYDVDGRPLVVSRGIGATESPLRLFADPDIRIVTLDA